MKASEHEDPALPLVQTQAQIDLLRSLPGDGSQVQIYRQTEWDAASAEEQEAIDEKLKAARTLAARGLVCKYVYTYNLSKTGQRMLADGFPPRLPPLTQEQALKLITEANWEGMIPDPTDDESPEPWDYEDAEWVDVERAFDRGHEEGGDAALSWVRDVLSRVE